MLCIDTINFCVEEQVAMFLHIVSHNQRFRVIHQNWRSKIQAVFRGRKHYPTQNVLAAVGFDLKFTYVLAGWEGLAHDTTILADALDREG